MDIDLRDGNGKHRAEDVQPQGFVPSRLAKPALRDTAGTQLEYIADGLGRIRLSADLITAPGGDAGIADRSAAMAISEEATRLQRLVKALASGALVLALVAAMGALTVGYSPAASAATVPAIEAPQPDPAPVKDRVRFGQGAWFDACSGDEIISAPLLEMFPRFGWLPAVNLPVLVQEYSVKRGRWVTRKVTLTNGRGVAASVVHLGGGVHTVRVAAAETVWTFGTVGTTRRVDVTTEPCDVI